jgi:hypothetical protein
MDPEIGVEYVCKYSLAKTMMTNDSIPTIRLGADPDEARLLLSEAIDAIVAAVLAGDLEDPHLGVVLTGTTLPAQTIAALVSALRRLREYGGSIVLTAESPEVRSSLALTGLDLVFAPGAVPAVEAGVPARSAGRTVRSIVAAIAAVFALTALPVSAEAPPLITDPAAILAHVNQRNPDLTSYQGRVHVDIQMTSFPFLNIKLDGSTYFKKPANYEVAFDRVPSYAKGFEKLYSDIGDATNWEKKFVVTYVGMHPFENRQDIELRMVQRVRGMIDHETVLIDPTAWTIDRLEYHYYNGGTISTTQHYSNVGGYTMPVAQEAEINIPHVRAKAYGTYSDYRTNVAVDDAVFVGKKN